jgi:hypothetical protein
LTGSIGILRQDQAEGRIQIFSQAGSLEHEINSTVRFREEKANAAIYIVVGNAYYTYLLLERSPDERHEGFQVVLQLPEARLTT